MKTLRYALPFAATVLLFLLFGCSSDDCSQVNNASVNVGDTAPEFRLPDHTGRYHKLSDYKGQNVVLAFYPAAFTPV